MASRLTRIGQQHPQHVNQRQDGQDEGSAGAIVEFQRWAQYGGDAPECDYHALRETLAWSKGHNATVGALKMYYESRYKRGGRK